MAGTDAGAVAKNGQKAEQFFPVTLGKRPTSLSGKLVIPTLQSVFTVVKTVVVSILFTF